MKRTFKCILCNTYTTTECANEHEYHYPTVCINCGPIVPFHWVEVHSQVIDVQMQECRTFKDCILRHVSDDLYEIINIADERIVINKMPLAKIATMVNESLFSTRLTALVDMVKTENHVREILSMLFEDGDYEVMLQFLATKFHQFGVTKPDSPTDEQLLAKQSTMIANILDAIVSGLKD